MIKEKHEFITPDHYIGKRFDIPPGRPTKGQTGMTWRLAVQREPTGVRYYAFVREAIKRERHAWRPDGMRDFYVKSGNITDNEPEQPVVSLADYLIFQEMWEKFLKRYARLLARHP